MEKNIEELAKYGEDSIKKTLTDDLNQIKNIFSGETDSNHMRRDLLNEFISNYNKKIDSFKVKYGVEFPKLQEEYNSVLLNIKESNIGVKIE